MLSNTAALTPEMFVLEESYSYIAGPLTGAAGSSGGSSQQMAPPVAPARPPSPMFVSVPPRTQRVLHSEAYLRWVIHLHVYMSV